MQSRRPDTWLDRADGLDYVIHYVSAANHQIVTKVFQPQQPTSVPTRAGAARLLFIQYDRESEGIFEIDE